MSTVRLPIGQFGTSFLSQREPPRVPPLSFLRHQQTEEIYVSSASAISIDAPLSSIGSDSGIYNTSTDCSTCSGTDVRKPRKWDQNIRTLYTDEENISEYDWQDLSLWMESEGDDEQDEEEMYETIYDIIRQEDSDFDDISDLQGESRRGRKKNITKIASAAGRKIKKLRRNWSLKKNDFTRSFSKIRRPSQTSQFYVDDSSSDTSENPPAPSPAQGFADESVSLVELTGSDNTSFTISLSVELQNNTYMQMSSRLSSTVQPADPPPVVPGTPPRPSRRKSRRTTQVILRPNVPPPAPPVPPLPSSPPPPLDDDGPPPIPAKPKELAELVPPPLPASLPPPLLLSASQLFPQEEEVAEDRVPQGNQSESSLEGTYAYALLNSEPLYQFYNGYVTKYTPEIQEHTYESVYYSAIKSVQQSNTASDTLQLSDFKIVDMSSSSGDYAAQEANTRGSALDLFEILGKRTLWSEIPEVRNSSVLSRLSDGERKLQEARFEILTSEASYLKSLNVLTSHFLPNLLGSADDDEVTNLFSYVIEVRRCSERFLSALDESWRTSYFLPGILRILSEHCEKYFSVYVEYCTNQIYQEKTLRKLMCDSAWFAETLRGLEASHICQSLSFHSFLMLPMQRVTRLPLLVSALLSRLPEYSDEHITARECMESLNKLVEDCNEGARSAHRTEELVNISKQLDFRDMKYIDIVSPSRWLVKQGDVVRVQWKDTNESVRLTFGKRNSKQSLVLFLLTDLLVITKKKGDDKFAVIDYCNRNLVYISQLEREDSPIPGLPETNCFPAWLTLLQNNLNKTQEMLLYFTTEKERSTWMSLLTSAPVQESGETVYADWDRPLVEFSRPCCEDDIVVGETGQRAEVLRSRADMLLVRGENTRKQAWVKKDYTREIASDHLRAKNFKQRYNFLKSLSEEIGT